MYNHKIPQNIQYKVRKYLQYYWREEFCNNTDAEMKIINQLNNNLKEKLLVISNQNNFPFLKENFSESIFQKMLPLIKQVRVNPEQYIFKKNDLDDCNIYFIEKGLVEICNYETNPLSKKQKYVNTFYQVQKGCCFGELSFFTGQSRQFTVRSLEFSILLEIQRNDFIQLLKEYPNDFEKFCMIRDQLIMHQNYRQIGISCYACKENSHVVGDCPTLHYVANKSQIIDKFSQGKKQMRQTKKRTKVRNQFGPLKEIQQATKKIKSDFSTILNEYIMNYLHEYEEIKENEKDTLNNVQENMLQEQYSLVEEQQPSNFQSISNFSNYLSQNPPDQYGIQMNCQKYTINNRNLDLKNDYSKTSSKSNVDHYMIQQLLPKLPSTGSILEKQYKDTYRDSSLFYQEENQNYVYQLEPINNENQQKRQNTIRQFQQNNSQFVSYSNLNQRQESFEEPSRKSNFLKKNQSHNELQNIENGISDQNDISPKQNMNSQFEEIKSNKKPKTITIKIPSPRQIQISQIKQQQYPNVNSNSPTYHHIQQGKQSIICSEDTTTKFKNKFSNRVKTHSFEDENIVFSYFQKQLKDMRGFCDINSPQLITESVKEFNIYFPEFNIQRVIEKIKNYQQKKNQKQKEKILEIFFQKQLMKKISSQSQKLSKSISQNDIQLPSSKHSNPIEDQKQQIQNFEQNIQKLTINIIKQQVGNFYDHSQKLIQSNINITNAQETYTEQAVLANVNESKQFDTDTLQINNSLIQQQRCELYCENNGEQSFIYSNTDHL